VDGDEEIKETTFFFFLISIWLENEKNSMEDEDIIKNKNKKLLPV
jgi:hypothetical protein